MRRSACNRLPPLASPLRPQPAIPAYIDTALVRPRAGLTGTAAVRQLAEDFRQAAYRAGGVSHDDLALLGWTGAQLTEHAVAANLLAQQLAGASL